MGGHVLLVSISNMLFMVFEADALVRYYMCSGKVWLNPLHTSRYSAVKIMNVEDYFKSRSKESLSGQS